MDTPSFVEDHISQIPALQLLQNLGYAYLTPEEAFSCRRERTSNVILETILEDQLRKLNSFSFKGRINQFSDASIRGAIQTLKDVPYDGLVRTNEKIYDLLTLGKSFEEKVDGDSKSFNLNYIDWKDWSKNVFHVTEEFEVARTASHETRRPDIICFVNGIPFAVIECKRPDIEDPLSEAISQQIRNQKDDEIPRLFVYSQLLLALSANGAKAATTGTTAKFWSVWRERDQKETDLQRLVNTPLKAEAKKKLFGDRYKYVHSYFDSLEQNGRLVTDQDKAIYSYLLPERLLELTYKFIVFDVGERKLARYQQYFAVKRTLERVRQIGPDNKRKGGVIWHTQGSGKSITMVMFSKCLALETEIKNPKIVLVTDRKNLDRQILKNFVHCGKDVVRAKSGEHLLELVESNSEQIITTVINKFDAALKKKDIRNDSPDIFCLIDEGHRSQYGRLATKMQQIFPKACYIGFTGTPLMRRDKNTAAKFGGIIDPYTIRDAVNDEAVLPLLYEGRLAVQDVSEKAIDAWFERVTEGLSEAQKADLKRKFSTSDTLNRAEQTIKQIAYDISDHYRRNFKGTGLKAQLAAPRKDTALKFKRYLDEFGIVSSEVVISGPDTREGHEDPSEETTDEVQRFWKKMMDKYGNEDSYNDSIVDKFTYDPAEPEIIIVVDKLLVGFDAPRNTALYICRSLRDHALLQAIARVNRLFEGKDFGYIIDYYGVIGRLNQALKDYGDSGLGEFDEEDLDGILQDIEEEVKKLPQRYSALWDLFKTVKNKADAEEYERLLGDEALRMQFYEHLSAFGKNLAVALSSVEFVTNTPKERVEKYSSDLIFFVNLRSSVKQRYAEGVNFKDYEPKIQKLLDTYVSADEIQILTPEVNIFEREKFEAEVAKRTGNAAKADTIAHQTKRTISFHFQEDPAFFGRFSKLLSDVIEEHRKQRLSDVDYLRKVREVMEQITNRTDAEIPARVRGKDAPRAFFGVLNEAIKADPEVAADLALRVDEIVCRHKGVDWTLKKDVRNRILNEVEDLLFELKRSHAIDLSLEEIDSVLDRCLTLAVNRYRE